jgi:hypothetical protein
MLLPLHPVAADFGRNGRATQIIAPGIDDPCLLCSEWPIEEIAERAFLFVPIHWIVIVARELQGGRRTSRVDKIVRSRHPDFIPQPHDVRIGVVGLRHGKVVGPLRAGEHQAIDEDLVLLGFAAKHGTPVVDELYDLAAIMRACVALGLQG